MAENRKSDKALVEHLREYVDRARTLPYNESVGPNWNPLTSTKDFAKLLEVFRGEISIGKEGDRHWRTVSAETGESLFTLPGVNTGIVTRNASVLCQGSEFRALIVVIAMATGYQVPREKSTKRVSTREPEPGPGIHPCGEGGGSCW